MSALCVCVCVCVCAAVLEGVNSTGASEGAVRAHKGERCVGVGVRAGWCVLIRRMRAWLWWVGSGWGQAGALGPRWCVVRVCVLHACVLCTCMLCK